MNRRIKSASSFFLVLVMACSLFAPAFADSDFVDVDVKEDAENLEIIVESQKVYPEGTLPADIEVQTDPDIVTIDGNVHYDDDVALYVRSTEDGNVTVNVTGDTTSDQHYGVQTVSEDNSVANVNIGGDAIGDHMGIGVSTHDQGTANVVVSGDTNGISVSSYDDSIASASASSVTGADSYGITVSSKSNSSSEVTVYGDVAPENYTAISGTSYDNAKTVIKADGAANGSVYAYAENKGNINVTVGGVNGSQGNTALTAHSEEQGISEVTVNGNVTSNTATAVSTYAGDNGVAKATIDGDVSGIHYGINASAHGSGFSSVTVTGKVDGGTAVTSAENGKNVINVNDTTAVHAQSFGKGRIDVTVNGEIYGDGDGIIASAHNNSETQIAVKGGLGPETDGIESYSYDSAKMTIYIGGDVKGTDKSSDIAAYANDMSSTDITIDGICYIPLYARSDDEGTMTVKAVSISNNIDAMSYGEGSKTTVDVTGNINGTLEAHATISGLTSASIGGDIVGTGYGVRSITDGGEVQVSIDGAILSGGGIYASSNNGGRIHVDIEKGITGTHDGIYSNNNRGQTDIDVNGDLIVEKERSNAIQAYSSAGTTTITIDGNVTNSGGNGIRVNDFSSGSTQITVSGDVTAENGFGVMTSTDNGETTIAINGDVSAETYGINASTRENGTASVSVDGDVTAENRGIIVSGDGTGDIDVLITGTLSGEKPVFVGSSRITEENLNITVWKIENENQETPDKIVSGAGKNYSDESIQYIIKLEQPEVGGSLSTLGTTESHGYQVAREGDTVTLKVTLEEGYELSAAFNGEGEKVQVITTQDADGNYYITVPKGGGVYLSVSLTQKSNDEASVSFSTTENYFDDSYLEFNKSIVQMILEAKENATVTADAGHWLSMMRMVFKALADRPDVTLEIIYYRGAQRMLLTIPAGTPVLQAIGISETVQFDTLAKLLKIEPVVFTTV